MNNKVVVGFYITYATHKMAYSGAWKLHHFYDRFTTPTTTAFFLIHISYIERVNWAICYVQVVHLVSHTFQMPHQVSQMRYIYILWHWRLPSVRCMFLMLRTITLFHVSN